MSGGVAHLSVFDDLSDAIVAVHDDDGRYVYANASANRLLGASKIVGNSIYELHPCESEEQVIAQLEALRSKGQLSGEGVLRGPDERRRRFRFRFVAHYMPSVHLAAARELSHASDPEETAATDDDTPRGVLFRAVFENVPEPVVLLDDNRRYVDANRAARKFVGMSKVDFHRRRLDDLTPAEYHGGLDEMWEGFLRSGVMQGVYPLVLGNGLERSVQFRAMAHIIPGRHVCTFRLADSEDQRSELRVEAPSPARNLTAREREVLTLLARGSSAEAIAEYAVLSPETVRTHIRNAMRKLGARSRPHAIAMAIKMRAIDP